MHMHTLHTGIIEIAQEVMINIVKCIRLHIFLHIRKKLNRQTPNLYIYLDNQYLNTYKMSIRYIDIELYIVGYNFMYIYIPTDDGETFFSG